MKFTLSASEIAKLQRPIKGKGGFQVLLRRLQRQIDGNTLTASPDDIEKLVRYSFEYGTGGFQERTKAPVV
jgi:hypothetical protein